MSLEKSNSFLDKESKSGYKLIDSIDCDKSKKYIGLEKNYRKLLIFSDNILIITKVLKDTSGHSHIKYMNDIVEILNVEWDEDDDVVSSKAKDFLDEVNKCFALEDLKTLFKFREDYIANKIEQDRIVTGLENKFI